MRRPDRTDDGKLVVDVGEHQRMVGELELLRDIHTAEGQIAKGEGVPHAEARSRVLAKLRS